MKALATLAFGVVALIGANFASTAPAAASNVGVYAGSNGFAIQVNDYGRYGYGYRNSRGACSNYWYRRNHPYRCGYRNYNPGYYGYYNNYNYNNYRDDWRNRHHRRHHWRDRDDDRRYDRRDRW